MTSTFSSSSTHSLLLYSCPTYSPLYLFVATTRYLPLTTRYASSIFRCAVADNLGVIMSRVSGDTLRQLAGFLLRKGPFPPWLDVLSSVCVCRGLRVPQLQEAILRHLLSAKSFEGAFEAGASLTRHRTFVETVRSANPATVKVRPSARDGTSTTFSFFYFLTHSLLLYSSFPTLATSLLGHRQALHPGGGPR